MKQILVINFTRMGDIIQTTPLLEGLREKWPATQIDLLVMRGFQAIAELVPGIRQLLLWDQDESVSTLIRGDNLAQIYSYHRRFIDELRRCEYDLIINVTHSSESAVLLRLLRGREKRGIVMDELGRKLTAHPWIDYFFNVTANRSFNDFNLVDIYRRIGDLEAGQGSRLRLQVPPEADQQARRWLASLDAERRPFVVLQPGANRDNRRWPASNYATLARLLYERRWASLLLIGSGAETELAERIVSQAGVPLLNLAGKTDLAQLTALLGRCDLLVSNDTGSMHIAAAMNTPTVALFLATALPQETGAYTEDTIILQPRLDCAPCSHHIECPHLRCRQLITPAAVLEACDAMLTGTDRFTDEQVRVFRPVYNRDSMLQLRLVSREPLQLEQLTAVAYRLLWKRLLDAVPQSKSAEERCFIELTEDLPEQLDFLHRYDPPEDPAAVARAVSDCCITLTEAESLGHRGFVAAAQLDRTRDPQRLQQSLKEITAVNEELFQLEMQHEFIRPICVLYRFNRENMFSDELDYLAREGKKMYHAVEARTRLLRTFLQELLAAQPWYEQLQQRREECAHA